MRVIAPTQDPGVKQFCGGTMHVGSRHGCGSQSFMWKGRGKGRGGATGESRQGQHTGNSCVWRGGYTPFTLALLSAGGGAWVAAADMKLAGGWVVVGELPRQKPRNAEGTLLWGVLSGGGGVAVSCGGMSGARDRKRAEPVR